MSFNGEMSKKRKESFKESAKQRGYEFGWQSEKTIEDVRIKDMHKESVKELMRSTMEVTLPDQAYEPGNTEIILKNGLEDVKKSSGKFKTKVDSRESRTKIVQSHYGALNAYNNSEVGSYLIRNEDKSIDKKYAYNFISHGNSYEKALNSPMITVRDKDFDSKDYAGALDRFLDLKVNLNITSANSFAKNSGYLKWLSDYYDSIEAFLNGIGKPMWENIARTSKYKRLGADALEYALATKKEYVKTVIDYYKCETDLIKDPSYVNKAGKSLESLSSKTDKIKDQGYAAKKARADAALAALMQKSKRFGSKGGYTFEKMNEDAQGMIKLWESIKRDKNKRIVDEDDELLFFKAHSYLLDRIAYNVENLNTGYIKSLKPILERYHEFSKMEDKSLSDKRKKIDSVLRDSMGEGSLYKPMKDDNPDDPGVKILSRAGHIKMDNVRQYFLRNKDKTGLFHHRGHTAFLAKAVFNQPEYIQKIAYYILEKGFEGGGDSGEILQKALSPAYSPDVEKIKSKSMVASKLYLHKRITGSKIYWNNLSAAIRMAKSLCNAPAGENSTAIKEYWKSRKGAGNPGDGNDLNQGNEQENNQENIQENLQENLQENINLNININPNIPNEENLIDNEIHKEGLEQNNESIGKKISQSSIDFVNKFNAYADFIEANSGNGGNLDKTKEVQAQKLLKDALDSTTVFFDALKEAPEGDVGSVKDGLETANSFIKENRRYLAIANNIDSVVRPDAGGLVQGNAKLVSLQMTGVLTSVAGFVFSCMSLHSSKKTMFTGEVLQKALVDIALDGIGEATDSLMSFINALAKAQILEKIGGVAGTVAGGALIFSGTIDVGRGLYRKHKATVAKKTLKEAGEFSVQDGVQDQTQAELKEKRYNNTYDIQNKLNKDKIFDGTAKICIGTSMLLGGLGSMVSAGIITTTGFLAASALTPVTAVIASGLIITKLCIDYKKKRNRIRKVIDSYINTPALVTAYKAKLPDRQPAPPDAEIEDMLRRQAAANSGCADMEDYFNYICEDYAKNLFENYQNALMGENEQIKKAYKDSIESLGINTKKSFTAGTIAAKLKG